ncbi:MAG: FAD-dependent pyridine nucleotide-disulfide oxidoreductase [Firmicutes bacterium]|nr:FAD-dependent pyridine nucleotide-disulfide oxidoreductase [Bacillota bacterium]
MRCIIIGNGIAGVSVARLLREKNQDIEIEMITRENVPYYSRINLIEFLAGNLPQENLFVFPDKWYADRNIKLHYGRTVVAIDPHARAVTLDNDEVLPFDQLVIASGSIPFRPPILHIDLPGIFTLRSLADAIAIRSYAAMGAKRAFVLGGGLLGIEAANSLKQLGLDVTVLEPAGRLLAKQLDNEGAAILALLLEERGLQLVLGTGVQAFCGTEKIEEVQLSDGRTLPADLVLVSTGVRPDLSCLAGSGIQTDKGVMVDDRMQSNYSGIYAVGDVAQWNEPIWGIVPAALHQAAVVAANIAGEVKEYSGITPANTLKVMGVDLAVYGEAQNQQNECEHVRRQDQQNKSYAKIVLKDQCVIGAIVIGNKKVQTILSKMVEARQRMSKEEAINFLDAQMGAKIPS